MLSPFEDDEEWAAPSTNHPELRDIRSTGCQTLLVQ